MSPLDPVAAENLIQQRKNVQRAMLQGRRWYLRSVLLMVIGVFASYRGGQVNWIIGIIMVVLAGLAWSLGRSIRNGARESMKKIELMQKAGA